MVSCRTRESGECLRRKQVESNVSVKGTEGIRKPGIAQRDLSSDLRLLRNWFDSWLYMYSVVLVVVVVPELRHPSNNTKYLYPAQGLRMAESACHPRIAEPYRRSRNRESLLVLDSFLPLLFPALFLSEICFFPFSFTLLYPP